MYLETKATGIQGKIKERVRGWGHRGCPLLQPARKLAIVCFSGLNYGALFGRCICAVRVRCVGCVNTSGGAGLDGAVVCEAIGAYGAGLISQRRLGDIEENAFPGVGTCR